MRTYRPDQWLRNWFLGGPETVDYTNRDQIVHSSPEEFAADLSVVWRNAANVCASGAQMVIRFGGISNRCANPLDIVKSSLGGADGESALSYRPALRQQVSGRQMRSCVNNQHR